MVVARPRSLGRIREGPRRRPPTIAERAYAVSNKRQQTMAKAARERAVREKRERKLEKKQAAAAERKARETGEAPREPDA
jgi:hypothetical protein